MKNMLHACVLSILFAGPASAARVAERLAEWKVHLPGLPSLQVETEKTNGEGANKVTELVAKGEKGRYLLLTRSTGLEAAAAARYSADRRAEIESVFERRFDGYFPANAKGTVCPKALHPGKKRLINATTEADALLFQATERRVPICLKELAKLKSVALFAYCPGRKEMFDVRYFQPTASYSGAEEKAILSFTCLSQP